MIPKLLVVDAVLQLHQPVEGGYEPPEQLLQQSCSIDAVDVGQADELLESTDVGAKHYIGKRCYGGAGRYGRVASPQPAVAGTGPATCPGFACPAY